ncbi:hypothetical protein KK062_15415 [Fulvivirgaceae bacterium PWU5]|uniref:Uncharacterized protein n=1 Tax=Dawidia cretensis TaxID=2782350 RepID=A0AAP2GQF7_9BACT|nr:hypothetical protein [Dawidia cretensis]MBT1709631.1 hypothetical protein [Dawidia cretensis]
MKKHIRNIVLALAVTAGIMPVLRAQQIIVYFHGPTAAMTTNFTGATASYIQASNCGATSYGFSHVVLDNQTAPIFRSAFAGLKIVQTYDSLTNASSILRRRLMQLRSMSNGLVDTVEINLYDDRAGIAAPGPCKCRDKIGGVFGVWPCASSERNHTTRVYKGWVMLGELAANHIMGTSSPDWWAWYKTVVHEFSHTQFALEYDASNRIVRNKWGNNGLAVSYGGDKGHWGDELQADEQSALDEGLATFWGLERHTNGRNHLLNWLNRNDSRLFLGSHSFLTGVPEMWNRPHVMEFTTTIPANREVTPPHRSTITLVNSYIETGARYELRSYRWLDVPGKFVFYNEMMFQAYAWFFFDQGLPSRTEAFDVMMRACQVMTPPNNRLRYPGILATALASELEAYAGTPAGRAAETNHRLVSSMFAYALYDIVTHFDISDAELTQRFSISRSLSTATPPQALTQYFTHRAAVKQLACPHLGGPNCVGTGTINFARAVTEVKNYFTDSSRILR